MSVVAATLMLRSRRGTGVAALALVLAGCGTAAAPAAPRPVQSVAAAPTTPIPISTPTSENCPDPAWSCTQQQRFAAAAAHARRAAGPHGHLAAVFVDRTTGATWRTGDTGRPGWTASTIKLAIAADMLDRFRTGFGMATLRFVPGFTRGPYWGFVRCSTDDLAHLIQHVLTRTDPADRAYLLAAMRGVARNQQWGVWAAGAAQHPGNKDGWSFESDAEGRHWVTATVGFAGPDERYVVAVSDQLDPVGTLPQGVHAVSDLVALLFGQPVPAPVTVPAPDG